MTAQSGKAKWAGLLSLVLLWNGVVRADEAEDKAVAFVKLFNGTIERDEAMPGKPVVAVSLFGAKITNDNLEVLAGLKSLRSLDLSGTDVTSAGLKKLAPLKHLNALRLDGGQVTDSTLKELRQINLLHALGNAGPKPGQGKLRPDGPDDVFQMHLASTKVTDAGLKELAGLKNLQYLLLVDTKVTHKGLAELAALKKLDHLLLSPAQMTDAALDVLHQIGMLHVLGNAENANASRPKGPADVLTFNLQGTVATSSSLKYLAEFKNLHTIQCSSSWITDAALMELRHLKLLHKISLVGIFPGEKRPKQPQDATHLNLFNALVTDRGLVQLADFKNLQSMNLSGTKITNRGLKLLTAFKKLNQLQLAFTLATDAGLKDLAELQDLQMIDLNGTEVTANGIQELQKALPKCKIIH